MAAPRYDESYGYGSDYRPRNRPMPASTIIPQRNAPTGDLDILDGEMSAEDPYQRSMDPSIRARQRAAGGIRNPASPAEDEILKLLQAFYDQFNSPLDYNDPFVRSILDNARVSTSQNAMNAGVFGPYSQNLAQQAYIKSAAGLQGERQRMAGQALGMLTDYKKDKRNFDYQKAKDSYQASLDNWNAQEGKNADLWRMVGGGLGAVGGGLLGIAGGPAGIIAGASAGFGAGQEIGGGAHQAFGGGQAPTWNPRRYGFNGG